MSCENCGTNLEEFETIEAKEFVVLNERILIEKHANEKVVMEQYEKLIIKITEDAIDCKYSEMEFVNGLKIFDIQLCQKCKYCGNYYYKNIVKYMQSDVNNYIENIKVPQLIDFAKSHYLKTDIDVIEIIDIEVNWRKVIFSDYENNKQLIDKIKRAEQLIQRERGGDFADVAIKLLDFMILVSSTVVSSILIERRQEKKKTKIQRLFQKS